jgi:hypothetical protein
MIIMEALAKFGLGDSTSLLAEFTVSQWGSTIIFQCLYDPYLQSPYEIKLSECSSVRWSVHSPENIQEEILSITDIQIKNTEDNRQKFIMFTEVFELIVVCKLVDITKK